MKFDLKLTDLSEITNPFVIFKNRIVDQGGYLIFSDEAARSYDRRNNNPIMTTQSSVSAEDLAHGLAGRDSVASSNYNI